MTAYYNEFDPDTAAWLRELIMAGVIADGVVDTRSIEDVRPADLEGFTQCHFFAGIGVWSHALRAAGWPDDRPVWTGSCPCQPFSAAGKGLAFADERHLWPAFHHLIKVRKPECVLGEQVASAAVDPWIDLVHADVEALGYAFGSVPFPSAGVGAPHIRDRTYWVANAAGERWRDRRQSFGGTDVLVGTAPAQRGVRRKGAEGLCAAGGLGNADHTGLEGQRSGHQAEGGRIGAVRPAPTAGESGGLADAEGERCGRRQGISSGLLDDGAHAERGEGDYGASNGGETGFSRAGQPGPTNGFWRDADWLGCRDGKWRPVSPGTFPLVAGASARVVRLRGYGNAINAKAAQVWIETVMECLP